MPRSGPASSRVDGYDRAAASRVLAGLAFPGLFAPGGAVDAEFLGGQRRIDYRLAPLVPAPGSHLTASQQRYLTSFMRPCLASLVTSATHRVTWNDSDGVPNVAHAGPVLSARRCLSWPGRPRSRCGGRWPPTRL